jgi:hypothetical protein
MTIWYIYQVIPANLQDVITMRERATTERNGQRLRDQNMDSFQFMALRSNKMKMNNLDSEELRKKFLDKGKEQPRINRILCSLSEIEEQELMNSGIWIQMWQEGKK